MIKLQQSESTDDVVKEALPDAWLRVARIVGCDAFVPLAHIPLAGFLANASLQPDLAVVAAGREHELDNYDPNDWQFASSGNRHVGIRTSTLDAKAAALDNLTGILECVGKSPVFRENSLSSILNVVQPLINFQLDDRIAVAAVQAFAAGIRCGKFLY